MKTTNRYYEMLDNAPEYVQATAALFRWSDNYDHGCKPSQLFMDMIGYSAEELGVHLYDHNEARATFRLGYLELDMLADALKEYAARPDSVYAWVEALVAADTGEDESEDAA